MGPVVLWNLGLRHQAINSPFDKHFHLRIDSLCWGQLLQELQLQFCSCTSVAASGWKSRDKSFPIQDCSTGCDSEGTWWRKTLCVSSASGLFLINSTTTGSNLWRALITEQNWPIHSTEQKRTKRDREKQYKRGPSRKKVGAVAEVTTKFGELSLLPTPFENGISMSRRWGKYVHSYASKSKKVFTYS